MRRANHAHDEYDVLIIGSGFGGSVAAMRFSQKGYRVAILEAGKRYGDGDFAPTSWNLKKFLWLPRFGCHGIQRITFLSHAMVLSGAGVGGGSLVYANTLYSPLAPFYRDRTVRKLGGEEGLAPFYSLARRMLGANGNRAVTEVDDLMRETAETFGRGKTFSPTTVGVYFGTPGVAAKDPYFRGDGPDRSGCTLCGGCMVGCRFNAKNTLDKNYLYFAEKLGAMVFAETEAVEIHPLGVEGSDGYEVATRSTTGRFGSPKRLFRARRLVISAGALGTVDLLLRMKERGLLSNLSDRLGKSVRSNSESIVGVTSRNRNADFSNGIAISSSVHPDELTHIEPVRYSSGSDAMGLLTALLTDGGGVLPRPLRFVANVMRHPVDFMRTLSPIGFARRSILLLAMQAVDNGIELFRGRRLPFLLRRRLRSRRPAGSRAIPTYIPVANEFARRLAKKIDGFAQGSIGEVFCDMPTTAHLLGGAAIGETARDGVVDLENRVFGYRNMMICDGSVIPANLGVNPSLTIVALTERALSHVPVKPGKRPVVFPFERKWNVVSLIAGRLQKKRVENRTSTKRKSGRRRRKENLTQSRKVRKEIKKSRV